MTSLGSRRNALGWIPSHPRPVPLAKVNSASLNFLIDIGVRGSVSSGHSNLSCFIASADCTAQTSFSELARCWAPCGVADLYVGAKACLSCSGESPSRSSSSDNFASGGMPYLSAFLPTAFRENMCCRLSPSAGPSVTHFVNRPVASVAALSSACFDASTATPRKDSTHGFEFSTFSVSRFLHALKAAASSCSCGSSIFSLWS